MLTLHPFLVSVWSRTVAPSMRWAAEILSDKRLPWRKRWKCNPCIWLYITSYGMSIIYSAIADYRWTILWAEQVPCRKIGRASTPALSSTKRGRVVADGKDVDIRHLYSIIQENFLSTYFWVSRATLIITSPSSVILKQFKQPFCPRPYSATFVINRLLQVPIGRPVKLSSHHFALP